MRYNFKSIPMMTIAIGGERGRGELAWINALCMCVCLCVFVSDITELVIIIILSLFLLWSTKVIFQTPMLALCYCHTYYNLCTSNGCIMHILYCGYYIIFISLQSYDNQYCIVLYWGMVHCARSVFASLQVSYLGFYTVYTSKLYCIMVALYVIM